MTFVESRPAVANDAAAEEWRVPATGSILEAGLTSADTDEDEEAELREPCDAVGVRIRVFFEGPEVELGAMVSPIERFLLLNCESGDDGGLAE